ncbi:uncharacterized protein LOC5522228 isoform X2 [Nematostella vectensis]|uniref:uncharacterized protein LOC5522228 isoform X2 n=1 Tax=Nematostella vectensis TaxID=45351 RepID=UPI0020777297|nr:uncharacterized protein LOC5522228 isoform X2 [Nematostella vectensis]
MLYTKYLLFLAVIATVERISASSISEPGQCLNYSLNATFADITLNDALKTVPGSPSLSTVSMLQLLEAVFASKGVNGTVFESLGIPMACQSYLRLSPYELLYTHKLNPTYHMEKTLNETLQMLFTSDTKGLMDTMQLFNYSVASGLNSTVTLGQIAEKYKFNPELDSTPLFSILRALTPGTQDDTVILMVFGFLNKDKQYLEMTFRQFSDLFGISLPALLDQPMYRVMQFVHTYRYFYLEELNYIPDLRNEMQRIRFNISEDTVNTLLNTYLTRSGEFRDKLFDCRILKDVKFAEVSRVTGISLGDIESQLNLYSLGRLVCNILEGISLDRQCKQRGLTLRQQILAKYTKIGFTFKQTGFKNDIEFENAVIQSYIRHYANYTSTTIADIAKRINMTEDEVANATVKNVAEVMSRVAVHKLLEKLEACKPFEGLSSMTSEELVLLAKAREYFKEEWQPIMNKKALWWDSALCYHLRVDMPFDSVLRMTLEDLLVKNLDIDKKSIPEYFDINDNLTASWDDVFGKYNLSDIARILKFREYEIFGRSVHEILRRWIGLWMSDKNECAEATCWKGDKVSCHKLLGSYRCVCPANSVVMPRTCYDIDECRRNIYDCPADSQCINTYGSYKCSCKRGYAHNDSNVCVDVNECTETPYVCSGNNSICENTDGSFKCSCKSGYTPKFSEAVGDAPANLTSCDDIDECALGVATCPASADCVNNDGSYTCRCKRGYTLNNNTCTDVNECTEIPYVCSGENSICENTDGSFKCSCKSGYTPKFSEAVGDAPANLTSCDDIDECKLNISTCPANRYCVNNDGSYTCKCKPGYTLVNNTCEDIDECALGVATCPASADCVNNDGSYTCRCKRGYELNNNECEDVNECLDLFLNTCLFKGLDCINLPGSLQCKCPAGQKWDPDSFYGTGGCVDLNECVETPYVCSGDNSICQNTEGSFTCSCKPGYTPTFSGSVSDGTRNLTSCDDVNECARDPRPCHENAACTNTKGSYLCRCNSGYTGDGKDCKPKRMFDLNRPRYVYCERKRRYENRARCPGGFNFFGKRYNHLWINCNGMMSVERHHFRKTPKDLTRKIHRKDIIFPFWADVDYSRYATALDVQFQELAKGDEDSSELLDKINKMVNESTDLGEDFASCAIIVTWKDTSPRYRYNSWNPYRDQKNTFQSALVSNGDTTVIMFLYAKDQMGWLADHGFKASMGWARSDGEYYQFSKSFTDDILRIDSHSFEDPQGNKREGVFIKVLGERLEPTPASICSQWVLSERRRGTFWYPRWNCPCSLWSVRRQFSFQIWGLNQGPDWWFQGTGRDWQRDVACYSFRPFLRGPNKACCYSRRGRDRGALITGSSLRAGRVCRYSPFVEADEYWKEMGMLDTCCRESTEYCSDYLAIRPAETVCTLPPWWLRWRPRPRIRRPRRTFFWGDPHITTVDGFGYSFNGLGDYVMMKSTNSHRIHTRTARPLASNGALAKATVFSGFALAANGSNVVQVMYDTSVSGNMSITVTNSTSCSHMTVDQLSANAPAVYTGLALTRKNATVVVIFDSGLTCEISPGVESIQMALTVPVEFENTTQGLMGKMNENKEDDLAFPNGTMIPVNSDEKKIFEFGQTWRVPNSDRLFVFSNCSKQPVFFDEAFEPVFLSDLNITDKMREACGNDKGCLLDYAATGNKELAVSGKSYREENLKAQEDLDNLPPEIDCDSILNATIGEQVTFKVTTSDPNNDKVTLQASQMPEGAMFNNKTGLTWKPLPSNNKSAMVLEFVATDEKGATAVQAVTIALCDCKNNGTCDFDTVLSVNNASKLRTVGCNCSEQYTGDFCENEPDPCLDDPCYEGVTCTRDKSEELGYTCGACPSGRTGDGVSCADINECADPADNNCPQECENTLGGYKCKCRPGYISSNNGRICTDINECDPILGSNDCGANTDCTNGPGNYSCTCKPGYKGDPKVKCEDINECNYPNDCSQMCSNTAGSYKCSCVKGFVLSNDSKTCADINECATPVTNDCEMICVNVRSSYKCACPTGFILNSDNKTCSVANSSKCDSTNGGCSHACTNSSGIVGCFCDKGYVLDSGNKTCKDIDECAEKTSGCGQRCKNLAGSYECSCDPGYELNADKITCKDIDECSRKTHKCSDSCLNTVGFYNCGCPPGYKLMSDEKTCQDVDECENAAQLCPLDMGLQCMNTKGSYICSCPPGRFAKKKKSGWMKCKDSKKFKLSRRFIKYRTTDLKFNDKLKDKGSDEFKNLAEMIENMLEEFFLRLLKESVECVVVAFRDGSVIADMELHAAANSSLSIDDINNALSNSSSMGEFSSDPSYGKVEDFNECLNKSDNDCHEHATCTNTAGSFTCACAKGYSGDGKACEPVPVPGESGLSTKELIAIIVCACIAGLILLSIMIWCCCFRNRVSKRLDEREFNEFPTYERNALQKNDVRPYDVPGGGDPDNMYLPPEDDDEMIGSYDVEGATFDNSGYKKDTPM